MRWTSTRPSSTRITSTEPIGLSPTSLPLLPPLGTHQTPAVPGLSWKTESSLVLSCWVSSIYLCALPPPFSVSPFSFHCVLLWFSAVLLSLSLSLSLFLFLSDLDHSCPTLTLPPNRPRHPPCKLSPPCRFSGQPNYSRRP